MSKNPTKLGSNAHENVPQMFPEKNEKLGNIDKKKPLTR